MVVVSHNSYGKLENMELIGHASDYNARQKNKVEIKYTRFDKEMNSIQKYKKKKNLKIIKTKVNK